MMKMKTYTYIIYTLKRGFLLGAILTMAAAPLLAQREVTLHLFHTSDTHSQIEPFSADYTNELQAGKGGAVRRATYVEQMRQQYPDMLLLDSGDFSQGSLYYTFFKGDVEVELMNLMGYDACAIGNHEFDKGLENLARLCRKAKFPVVCANYRVEWTALEGLVKPYTVIQRSGLKIGIFGLSPDPEGLIFKDWYEGIVYEDPVRCANEVAALLKEKEKCDVVICLSHLGWQGTMSDEVLIPATRNIDIVLGGHTHSFFEQPKVYRNADGKEVLLQHIGKQGTYMSKTELKFQGE